MSGGGSVRRLVHLTDLHFSSGVPDWASMVGKRAIGAFNLHVLGRERAFSTRVRLQAIAHAASLQADLALLSGDMTALALEREFATARRALLPLLQQQTSLVLAGNHDVYTRAAHRQGRCRQHFGAWMGDALDDDVEDGVRVCRAVDGLTLLALDSCVPTAIGSRGRVPSHQLEQLRRCLKAPTPFDDDVIVLCLHYPLLDRDAQPYERKHYWHALSNGADLVQLLRDAPARARPRLVLHGHVHRGFCVPLDAETLVCNPGSAGLAAHAALNLYEIDTRGRAIKLRRWLHDGDSFVEQAVPYAAA